VSYCAIAAPRTWWKDRAGWSRVVSPRIVSHLTFVVSGTAVYTNRSTKYRQGNCRHLDVRRPVSVVGERQPDGRLRDDRIDVNERD
jgi:hypothetical protein